MTTEPFYPVTKHRRFTAGDGIVFALALSAAALPFASRWMAEAKAVVPQIAVRADVSPIRPIDYALGYAEQQAEAAFFEGLEQPVAVTTDQTLDLALAAPEPHPVTYAAPPRAEPDFERPPVVDLGTTAPADAAEEDLAFEDDVELAKLSQPEPSREVASVTPPVVENIAPKADEIAAAPKVAEAEPALEPEPEADVETALVRVTMSAPPTMTPVPVARPSSDDPEDMTVASLNLRGLRDSRAEAAPVALRLPLAPSPSRVEIDEAPLPPPVASEPTVVAMAEPVTSTEVRNDAAPTRLPQPIQALPADVTPAAPKPAPVAKTPEKPKPAPAPKISNGPRIALVIAAAGLNTNVTRFAIEALPEGVTIAFAPIKAEARTLAQEAKDGGHTVLVEIPMEPINKTRDPGPLTLRVSDPVRQNLGRLNEALSRIPAADGVSSYLGARINSVEGAAAPIMGALRKRNMVFFENEPTSRSVLRTLAKRSNLPYARGVTKIDRDRNGAAIRASLDALEKQARARGSAVGVGTALRGTISTVALWAKEAEKRGVRFVPITEIAR